MPPATGKIDDCTISGIRNGESYEVTFILNNGQATADSQTWDHASLVCTIWRFNTDRSARFQVSLRTFPPGSHDGSVTTAAHTSAVTPRAGPPGVGGIAPVSTLGAYVLTLLALCAAGLGLLSLRAHAAPHEHV